MLLAPALRDVHRQPTRPALGDIYQVFSSPEEGVATNVIQFGLPLLTQDENGARLTVTTSYSVRSSKGISLTFERAKLSDVRAGPLLELLLAPALLPRGRHPPRAAAAGAIAAAIRQRGALYPPPAGWVNHQLLLWIREASVEVPLMTPSQALGRSTTAVPR